MQFYEVITENNDRVVVNKNYIVKILPKDNDFKNGAAIYLDKEAVPFSTIHIDGANARNFLNWVYGG